MAEGRRAGKHNADARAVAVASFAPSSPARDFTCKTANVPESMVVDLSASLLSLIQHPVDHHSAQSQITPRIAQQLQLFFSNTSLHHVFTSLQ